MIHRTKTSKFISSPVQHIKSVLTCSILTVLSLSNTTTHSQSLHVGKKTPGSSSHFIKTSRLQVKTHAGIYEHYEYVRPYEQTKHIGFPTVFTLLPIV